VACCLTENQAGLDRLFRRTCCRRVGRESPRAASSVRSPGTRHHRTRPRSSARPASAT
jgi:hypothetical protein